MVSVQLTAQDFAYFDEFTHQFTTDPGKYDILVGVSSRDVRGSGSVVVDGGQRTFPGM